MRKLKINGKKKKTKGNDDFEGEQEYSIRKRNLDSLQKEMDSAIEKRKHRTKLLEETKIRQEAMPIKDIYTTLIRLTKKKLMLTQKKQKQKLYLKQKKMVR